MHKLWPPKFATVSVKSVPGEPRYKGFHDGFISRVHLSRWWMLVDMKESRHPINLRTGELPLESIPQVFQFLHQIWYTWRFLSHPLVHHVYHVLNHVSYVSFVCGPKPWAPQFALRVQIESSMKPIESLLHLNFDKFWRIFPNGPNCPYVQCVEKFRMKDLK